MIQRNHWYQTYFKVHMLVTIVELTSTRRSAVSPLTVLLAQVVGGTHQGVPCVTAVRDPSVVIVRGTS